MTGTPLLQLDTLFLLVFYVVFSSLAGQWLATFVPWRKEILQSVIPRAFGFMLAPFLVGLIAVVLLALPGNKTANFFTFVPLIVLAVPALFGLRARYCQPFLKKPEWSLGVPLLRLFWFFWIFLLLFNASFYVLTQNDALEYAIVGRSLFDTGSLANYPAISPETTANGFYGPWTHPPLYVAMIALVNYLQGHADFPGAIRYISPWFLIVATHGVWSIGRQLSERAGAFAALITISAPLLFLGADSSLIDALTVCGFVLLMTVLYGADLSATRSYGNAGISIGAVIGVVMWSHSQTILFLPVSLFVLIFLMPKKSFSEYFKLALPLIIIASLLASPAYLRNLFVMGAFISDQPAVFALEKLDWDGYFAFARGLDHTIAIVQYGLFKGWFALEAFGFAYWFMTVGFIFLGFKLVNYRKDPRPNSNFSNNQKLLIITTSCLFICYFLGTLVSILLNMNLMIKNERYLLTTLPAVALIGGFGLDRFFSLAHLLIYSKSLWRDGLLIIIFCAQILAISSTFVVGFYYRFRNLPVYEVSETNINKRIDIQDNKYLFWGRSLSDFGSINNFPSLESIEYMNATLPKDAIVLASRPADFYYLDRQMLSYLDPRLIPIYRQTDPVIAMEMLDDLGVTHFHMVDYYLPSFYNSVLSKVIADPSLSNLIYDMQFHQVYELIDSGKSSKNQFDLFANNDLRWVTYINSILGGRKKLSSIKGQVRELGKVPRSVSSSPFFHRDYSTTIFPAYKNSNGGFRKFYQPVIEGEEYALKYDILGRGYVKFNVNMYRQENGFLVAAEEKQNAKMYEVVLSEGSNRQEIHRRFFIPVGVNIISISIEHMGRSTIEILSASILKIEND